MQEAAAPNANPTQIPANPDPDRAWEKFQNKKNTLIEGSYTLKKCFKDVKL